MSLLQEVSVISTNWKQIIEKYPFWDTLNKEYEKELLYCYEFIELYPPLNTIFRCFTYFNIEDTKLVIIGQDPYHGKDQATGLCFGVNEGQKIPPSLRNIYKCLESKNIPLPKSNLEDWAKNNILMLNSALSVRAKSPGTHAKLWHPFTQFILKELLKINHNCKFVIWGAFAHKVAIKAGVPEDRCYISSHPSPFSANRKYKTYPSFMESSIFDNVRLIVSPQIETSE